jgi:hypothetical protein
MSLSVRGICYVGKELWAVILVASGCCFDMVCDRRTGGLRSSTKVLCHTELRCMDRQKAG